MTTRVLTVHGIAPEVQRHRFSDRNMLDAAVMATYLAGAPPFVPLADALAGRGTALTIDDAVNGAAEAALLARSYGHAVTLFVNPWQIESGRPYAFVALNALLDAITRPACEFNGRRFATEVLAGRQALRREIKTWLARVPSEEERLQRVGDLAARWNVSELPVPAHFRTLGRADVQRLIGAGVAIENHGWSHVDHAHLSASASAREIREGRAWLRRELGVDARFFAAPFGEALPSREALAACEVWFMASDRYPARAMSKKVWNRGVLDLPRPGAPERDLTRSLLRVFNWSRFRLSGLN